MNILFVCNKNPFPPKDGGQIATYAMVRGMVEAGHSVTVAAINTKKHFLDPTTIPTDIPALQDYHSTFLNTDITPIGLATNFFFSRQPYTASRFVSKDFELVLQDLLAKKTYDIVQLEGLYLCSYIPFIRKHSKATIFYRAHNVEFEIWERLAQSTKNPIKKIYLQNLTKRIKRFETATLNQYDIIVPITQRDADKYNSLGNTRPTVVAPTGIFTKDLPQIMNKTHVSLFHIGALDWAPNQQGLIWFLDNCWNKIRQGFPTLELHVAGRNAPTWFIEKLQIPGVVYCGEVPSAYTFMAEHAIMIVPLLAGGGMRIKILEGLSFGKCIVSTSIGAEGIPAEHGKEICIANTAESFVNEILQLIQHQEKIQEIGTNAQAFVQKKFDNNQIVNNILSFYEQHKR